MTKLMQLLANKASLGALLIIAALATIAGDLFAKYWSLNKRPVMLWFAIIGYFAGSIFYIPSLLKEGLVVTSTIWSLVATMGFILIGILIFREKLTNMQLLGVIFGVISIVIFVFAEK